MFCVKISTLCVEIWIVLRNLNYVILLHNFYLMTQFNYVNVIWNRNCDTTINTTNAVTKNLNFICTIVTIACQNQNLVIIPTYLWNSTFNDHHGDKLTIIEQKNVQPTANTCSTNGLSLCSNSIRNHIISFVKLCDLFHPSQWAPKAPTDVSPSRVGIERCPPPADFYLHLEHLCGARGDS